MPRIYISKATSEFQKQYAIDLISGYGRDAILIRAIAEKESQLYPFALRVEPGLKQQQWYRDQMSKHNRDPENLWNTASYGLMQILYATALDYDTTLGMSQYLTGYPELTLFLAVTHLKKLMSRYDLPDAISAYNWGSPTDRNRANYVEPILRRIEELENGHTDET